MSAEDYLTKSIGADRMGKAVEYQVTASAMLAIRGELTCRHRTAATPACDVSRAPGCPVTAPRGAL